MDKRTVKLELRQVAANIQTTIDKVTAKADQEARHTVQEARRILKTLVERLEHPGN